MGVPTPTSAPTPFSEGDPRNAKYFENLAALEHSLTNTLASDQQDREAAQSAYGYSAGQLDRQLPLTLQATRNTANQQGLLESGQLAQRAGSVESKYAAQRGRLTTSVQAELNKLNTNEQQAREAFALGQSKAATTAREEGLAETEKEAPTTTVAPTPVSGPIAVGPATGRSQPMTLSQQQARNRAARSRAVKKVVG